MQDWQILLNNAGNAQGRDKKIKGEAEWREKKEPSIAVVYAGGLMSTSQTSTKPALGIHSGLSWSFHHTNVIVLPVISSRTSRIIFNPVVAQASQSIWQKYVSLRSTTHWRQHVSLWVDRSRASNKQDDVGVFIGLSRQNTIRYIWIEFKMCSNSHIKEMSLRHVCEASLNDVCTVCTRPAWMQAP